MKLIRTNRERTRQEELSENLENMYRRVAELEKQGGAGPAEDLDEHYGILKLDPSASVEDVKEAYIHLISVWDPERFTANPEWKERAEAKRVEISEAYDTIMARLEKDLKDEPGERLIDADERPFPQAKSGRQNISRRSKIAILAAAAVVLSGIFIWPTPYHHDTMTGGGKTYPIRMNRFTGQIAYFEGGTWNPMPVLRVEMSSATPTVNPPEVASKVSVQPPVSEAPGIQKAEGPVQPVKPEGPQKTAPAVPKELPFTIQVGAIRDGEKARAVVNELKRSGMNGHLEAVTIKGQGTWYRIYVGRFTTKEEALKHLNDRQWSGQYPGRFVQKINR